MTTRNLVRAVGSLALTAGLLGCANVGEGNPGDGGSGGGGTGLTLTRLTTPVPVGVPQSFEAEPGDQPNGATATGVVEGRCDEEGFCEGFDPVDQFTLVPGASGNHAISLNWDAGAGSDLDLFFLDSAGLGISQSTSSGTLPELISQSLVAGQTYVVHVQTFEALGVQQGYTVQVTPP